jgi:molecular chaperone DnaK (HSP70)
MLEHRTSSLAYCGFLITLLSSIYYVCPLPDATTGFVSLHQQRLQQQKSSSSSNRGNQKFSRKSSSDSSSQQNDDKDSKKDDKKRRREIGIGIDLGTTFSAVAFLQDDNDNSRRRRRRGIPTIIPIPNNGRTMPSLVSLGPNSTDDDDDGGQHVVWVGKEAAAATNSAPVRRLYCNVKRVIGTGGRISQDIVQVVPYCLRNPSGKTYKKNSLLNQLHDAQEYPTLLSLPASSSTSSSTLTTIRPEVITSHILARLKAVAEDSTGCRVTRAVIGVPAYFHDAQRAATIQAAAMAGMNKVKLLREPEAAALAYGIGKSTEQTSTATGDDDDDNTDELVLVFDLGGGTFDVSMLLVGGGVTEIICTSGDVQLGGSNFDLRVAHYFQKLLTLHHRGSSSIPPQPPPRNWSAAAKDAIVKCAEAVRIHLSNNRKALLALPLLEESWTSSNQMDVILPVDFQNQTALSEAGTSNSTHVIVEFTRQRMEQLCKEEFQALLRPVREVAIVSGALLPGDSRPSVVEAALEMEQRLQLQQQQQGDEELIFDDFYKDENEDEDELDGDEDDEDPIEDERILLQLQEADVKQAKKAQQRGRRRSRTLAKEERRYREERRKLETKKNTRQGSSLSSSSSAKDVVGNNVKVRDGISGRPISRVVLVGGATRMPAIGRLIATLTGVVPQKTVNPDEAVALGCAVHVGVLDGVEGMGTVLNPMQAAILQAVAQQQLQQQQQQQHERLQANVDDDDDVDDDEFSEVVEYY